MSVNEARHRTPSVTFNARQFGSPLSAQLQIPPADKRPCPNRAATAVPPIPGVATMPSEDLAISATSAAVQRFAAAKAAPSAGPADHGGPARLGFAALGLVDDAMGSLTPQAAVDRAADAGAFLELTALAANTLDQT